MVASCWLFLYDLYYDGLIHEHQHKGSSFWCIILDVVTKISYSSLNHHCSGHWINMPALVAQCILDSLYMICCFKCYLTTLSNAEFINRRYWINEWIWNFDRLVMTWYRRTTRRKTCPHPTSTGLMIKTDLRSDRPETNGLSHSTAFCFVVAIQRTVEKNIFFFMPGASSDNGCPWQNLWIVKEKSIMK
jgi:hypothetical protein